ncbi:hypothetical protein QFC21_006863 [Naganishia friedmannii]|uniref:Uncharacterized protein n=1 Tax=Naganishia friedmannii TaxID=89922 RepID=A0ACC2UZE2_9TREE|nr:hypothetical protein QFC21_006863 [Naganishia friedmannii]
MPLHFLGSIAETTSISLNTVFYCTCLVGLLLVFKTVWVEGRKCTWERDWAGKFLIIIVSRSRGQSVRRDLLTLGLGPTQAPPSPLVYALLDHLVNLPHPPQVLYLPPIPSPLPQELLTILHAIRLSAASKTGGTTIPVASATTTSDTNNIPDETEEPQESSIPSASLHCDPLPRSPSAIKEFIRRWAIKPPGTGDDGRRIDAIVWADEWSVDSPLKMFRTRVSGKKGEELVGDTWAGIHDDDTAKQPLRPEEEAEATARWTAEEAKFFFLNSMLPFLLKAPMERSIRLVNVLGPFYSAAVPLIGSSVEAQGKAADQLLSSSSAASASEEKTTSNQQKQKQQRKQRASTVTTATVSPIVQSGKASLRNILLWKHLQKILDALASASHNQASSSTFEIPPVPGVPVPTDADADAEEEKEGSGLRQRKAGGDDAPTVEEKAAPKPTTSKKITVQSNILALPVVIGFNRWGIIRPLMGLPNSYLGWALYILLAPLIYLLTPSTNSALHSILYALSAPVLYDDDDGDSTSERTAQKDDGNNGEGEKKGKSTGKAGRGRRDGVKGGGIIRDASWIPYPFAPSWADPLASKIWDQLEVRVEAGLKAASEEGSSQAGNGERGSVS